jgi:hypothetical protein
MQKLGWVDQEIMKDLMRLASRSTPMDPATLVLMAKVLGAGVWEKEVRKRWNIQLHELHVIKTLNQVPCIGLHADD